MNSPDLCEQVTTLRQTGLTLKAIAEQLGVSMGTVWRYDNSKQVKVNPKDIERKHIWALYRDRKTIPEIADLLELDVYWVHSVIHKPKKDAD